MFKTNLTPQEVDRLEANATRIPSPTGTYYFMPYWFKSTDEPGAFELYRLDSTLPRELTDLINNKRNDK